MKLLTRMVLLFLTAFVLVTAAYAEHSDTDIAYPVTGGNIYFDAATGAVTGCDKSITEAAIPAQIDGVSVTSIAHHAFFNCTSLTSVEIPEGVTSIGAQAFSNCTSLTGVTIPYSVTAIVSNAFEYTALTSVTIPYSVASIEEEAFGGCASLTHINVERGNVHFSSLDGVLFNKKQTSLICYPAGKAELSYEIPGSVTSIGNFAFHKCALEGVTIPDSVTSIERGAFYDCAGLTNVTIPDGVTSIKWKSFQKCTGLTSVTIPDGVTFIDSYAFCDCTGLTNVTIPDSVTSIGAYAFCDCAGLTNVTIPNGVTFIGGHAFGGWKNLTSVTIPASVTSIGQEPFYGCSKLADVYYGGSKEQWEQIDGIDYGGRLMSDALTIHYNASMPETPVPEFTVSSAPLVGGHAISAADLSGLTEISVPVTVSAESAVSVTICVPFFDGGRFLGMGFVTATVDKTTQSVTVPVTGNVSGAGKLNVIFVDTGFRPLSAMAFDIAA